MADAPGLVTDYMSIPAAAFTPLSQSSNYENHGRYIIALGNDAILFAAPVYFPQEAIIKRISACFFDDFNHYTWNRQII